MIMMAYRPFAFDMMFSLTLQRAHPPRSSPIKHTPAREVSLPKNGFSLFACANGYVFVVSVVIVVGRSLRE
jgi:hypothetical protein